MSFPKKSTKLRSLLVNNIQFHWRFSTRATQSTLVAYGPMSGRQPLTVTLLNWKDEWLDFPAPTDNKPKTIGPCFVRQAIEFGLANGWQPEEAGKTMEIEWQHDQFSIRQ